MGQKSQRTWMLRFIGCLTVDIGLISVIYRLLSTEELTLLNGVWITLAGIGAIACTVISLICFDIYQLDPSDSLNLTATKEMYISLRKCTYYGMPTVRKFMEKCKDVDIIQEQFLLDLLKHNYDTVYAKDHKFAEVKSIQDFRATQPLCEYDNFKPYVDRICDGEKEVLTAEAPFCLAKTSGTTGEGKRIPATTYKSIMGDKFIYCLIVSPPMKGAKMNLKKEMILGNTPKIETTKSGIKCGPLTYFYRQDKVGQVSPAAVFQIAHETTSFYVHAIFACKEREIGSFQMVFAHQVYSFFTLMENNWKRICDDIEHGTITLANDLVMDDTLREKIQDGIDADPKRAEEVRREFGRGSKQLALRLWPGLSYCRLTATGSMAVYMKFLQDQYLKDVVLVPNGYGGSEGFYGVNLTHIKDDPSYHLAFLWTFFEFIPEVNVENANANTLLAHEVKQGELYELVITSGNGLYRYRMGDVVEVTGFTHKCPIIEFRYRTGQVLNILGEKTTETVLYSSVTRACDQLGVDLVDYTSCEDLHLHGFKVLDGYKRHYVLFLELSRVISENESKEFDSTLQACSSIYTNMRKNRQSVAPMEVLQVKLGTFLKLKDRMIADTQNPQYKLPRALRKTEHLQFLLNNSVYTE